MSASVFYTYQGHEIKTSFTNAHSKLPVLTKAKGIKLMPWGRRQDQAGNLPLGGWARLMAIKAGQWDAFFPKPVRLPITQFIEMDLEGKEHQYTLTAGQWVQGVLAHYQQEIRVYIVTILPEGIHAIHERWPRIMCG